MERNSKGQDCYLNHCRFKIFISKLKTNYNTEKGSEFVNATVQYYLKCQGIIFHMIHNHDIEGAIVERFNRTLKTEILNFAQRITHSYLDVINKLLTSNNSVHSTIGMPGAKSTTPTFTQSGER